MVEYYMSRSISFRAWNVTCKYMVKSATSVANVLKKHINKEVVAASEPSYFSEIADSPNKATEEYLLMQGSGLMDKNGVEIFEGDIVEQWTKDAEDDTDRVVGMVEYLAPSFRIKLGPDKYTSLINYGTNLEVLGNVWENPLTYYQFIIPDVEK